MEKQQEPKPQPATKTELLLDVAMEAQYFRTSTLAVIVYLQATGSPRSIAGRKRQHRMALRHSRSIVA